MTADPTTARDLDRGGLPATAALVATLALSIAAGWLDLRLYGGIGLLVSTVFVLGCVTTVLTVRRRGVLLVMLSTPLVPIIAILVVVLAFTPRDPDTTVQLLATARPVIAHFPAIVGTTALVVVLGVTRLVLNRRAAAA
ncbi:DUF6542 domain-containing protein [Amycolatopsis sp. GM8]|uniref:DUF6542 domain-containing protein n=1 Tax=Amycolatopsis sp. GM8 TaxID=2896530 RepID=UPI001F276A2C|nr:DUF6542 domain-containing protein [Amycolatopsis sp. GM8]